MGLGYASHTNLGYASDVNSTFSLLSGGAVQLKGAHWLQLELMKPIRGYKGSNYYPAVIAGWLYDASFHQFRITLGNTQQLDSHWLITTEGMEDSRKIYGGFIISRRF